MNEPFCPRCGAPLANYATTTLHGATVHAACPTPEQLERAARLGRGPTHTAQLVALYPVGARGRYV